MASPTEQIRVDLLFTARNVERVNSQILALRKNLRTLTQAEAAAAGIAGSGGRTSALTRQVADYRQLNSLARLATREAKAYGAASYFGIEKARKSTAQFRREFRDFQKEQKALGTPIVGNPRNIGLARANFQSLKTSLKDVNKAGIANQNTLRTLEDGMARVGGRGFTAFERVRVQSWALKKDIASVGQSMMDMGKQSIWSSRQLTMNLTLPIVAFAGMATREFLKVQNQFFQLQKVMEFGGATNTEEATAKFADLRAEIVKMSEDLGQSQAVVTGVFRDVAALGLSDEKLITGWAKGIQEIAAIGDVDLSVATEFFRTTNALFTEGTQNEKLEQTLRLMEQFSAIADETSLQLKDLADAFPEVAPVMQKMGFEASETAAALAGMYKLGIPASEAAHALKFGFQRVVGPTKDAKAQIDRLNIEFFDMAGQTGGISQARMALFNMAKQLEDLSEEDYGKVLGEIVGNRQTARWGSFMKSVVEGEKELARAMDDRKLSAEELSEIDSDYMRGLLASGEIQRQYNESVKAGKAQPGLDFSVLEDPGQRFRLAMDMYRADPATQWNIMVTTLKNALINAGRILAPVIATWGQKLADIAKSFSNMNPTVIKFIGGILALTAALGPMMVGFAVMKTTFGALIVTMSKLIPMLGVKNLMPAQAAAMLAASPGRQDIGRVGSRTFMMKRGALPASATMLTGAEGASVLRQMSSKKAGVPALSSVQRDLGKASSSMTKYGAAGLAANKGIAKASAQSATSMSKAVAATDAARLAQVRYENAITQRSKVARAVRKGHFLPGGVSHAQGMAQANAQVAATKAASIAATSNAASLAGMATADAAAYGKASQKAMAKEARKAARAARFSGAGWSEGFRTGVEKPMTKSTGKVRGALRGMAKPFTAIKNSASTATGAMIHGFSAAADAVAKSNAAVTASAQAAAASRAATVTAVGKGQFLPGGKPHAQAMKEVGRASLLAKFTTPLQKLSGSIKGVGGSFAAMLPIILMASVKIIAIIGAVVAVIGTLAMVFYSVIKTITENWDKIRKAIEPSLQTLRSAFERFKEVLKSIGDTLIKTITDVLFQDNPLGGDKAVADSNMWQMAAAVISNVLEAVATALEWISNFIETVIVPIFSYFANIIGSFAGFWAKLFTGDMVGALKYFVKYVYSILQPIFWVLEKIADGVVWLVEKIVSMIGGVAGFLANIPIFGGMFAAAEGITSWAENFLASFRDQDITGLLGQRIDQWLSDEKFSINLDTSIDDDQAEDAGEIAGEEAAEAMNDTLAEEGGKNTGGDIAKNILEGFIPTLQSKVREQMDSIKQMLEEAFAKNIEDRLKKFDNQIQSIEDLKKKEEELLATQEYIERKRELMQQRALDVESYRRNRALAIYEGRVDDVRQLDLEMAASGRDFGKSLIEIENDRQKYLIDKARETTVEKINAEKTAEEQRLRILEEGFKKQLELILKYEPTTIAAFDGMLGKLKVLADQFAVQWPDSIRSGASYYVEAITQASDEIVQQFAFSANSGVMNWALGFISGDALEILKNNAMSAGAEAGAAYGSGFAGAVAGVEIPTPGEGENAWLELTPEKLANWSENILTQPKGPAAPPPGPKGPEGPSFSPTIQRILDRKREQENDFYRNAGSSRGTGLFPTSSRTPRPTPLNPLRPMIGVPGQSYTPELYFPQTAPPSRGRDMYRNAGRGGGTPSRAGGGGSDLGGFWNTIANAINLSRKPLDLGEPVGERVIKSLGKGAQDTMNRLGDNIVNWKDLEGTANRAYEIGSPSKVFYRVGVNVLDGLIGGLNSQEMWLAINVVFKGKILSLVSSIKEFAPKGIAGFGSAIIGAMSREIASITPLVKAQVTGLALHFGGFKNQIDKRIGNFGVLLGLKVAGQLRLVPPFIKVSLDKWFAEFENFSVKIQLKIGPFGVRLAEFIKNQLNFIKFVIPSAIDSVAGEFSSFGRKIIESILSGATSASGNFDDFGKKMFNTLVKFLNEKILKPLREYMVPAPVAFIGGQRPFAGLQDVLPILHNGGVVGMAGGMAKATGAAGEVAAVLMQGEGVLPLSAMNKIGPQAFELLRRGMIGEAVATMSSGGVVARMPRISSMSMNSNMPKSATMEGGDIYINVDTFIGQEEWFNQLASQYDMKVSARRARSNGSQSRVISSYNSNERNTYR